MLNKSLFDLTADRRLHIDYQHSVSCKERDAEHPITVARRANQMDRETVAFSESLLAFRSASLWQSRWASKLA